MEDFKEIELISDKYYFEEVINPSSIGFHGEKVILGEAWRVPEELPRLHLINSEDWTYDKPKGKHGQGPLEITDAAQILDSPNSDSFWIYNMNGRKLVNFSPSDTSLLGTDEWRLSEDMATIRFIEKTKDGGFLATPWDGGSIIQEFDDKGDLLASYGKWDSIPDRPDLGPKEIGELSSGWFKGNPNEDVFVCATLYRDILKVFDNDTKEFITIYGPNLDLPKFELHETRARSVFFSPQTTYRYRDIVVTADYVFALYGGYSQVEVNQTGKIAEDIFVFDHQGTPIWNLKLDRSILEMVINEKTNQIYGLTIDREPGIAVFDIPEEVLAN